MEKRRHLRIGIDNYSVDVNDGIGLFQGAVADVSRSGLCMTDLSKRLNGSAKKMTIVVSGKQNHFKMLVKPRWYADEGGRKSVGAEILNTPWAWTEFVMENEPIIERDVWDEIYL